MKLTEELQQLNNRAAVQSYFQKIRNAYGVRTVAYFGQHVTSENSDDPYLAVTYSSDWVQHYIDNNYVLVDPVLKEGFKSILPIHWDQFDRSPPKLKQFFGESNEFGLGKQGITFPVRGRAGDRALFTLTSNDNAVEWSKKLLHLTRDFQIISYMMHDAVCRIEGKKIEDISLAPRELECLKWACRGKTTIETGMILGITERTVRFYLDTARHKLGASNVTHAVSKALSLGIITTL
jgi:DNA-binding CsgD family transcriptional regulator